MRQKLQCTGGSPRLTILDDNYSQARAKSDCIGLVVVSAADCRYFFVAITMVLKAQR